MIDRNHPMLATAQNKTKTQYMYNKYINDSFHEQRQFKSGMLQKRLFNNTFSTFNNNEVFVKS